MLVYTTYVWSIQSCQELCVDLIFIVASGSVSVF